MTRMCKWDRKWKEKFTNSDSVRMAISSFSFYVRIALTLPGLTFDFTDANIEITFVRLQIYVIYFFNLMVAWCWSKRTRFQRRIGDLRAKIFIEQNLRKMLGHSNTSRFNQILFGFWFHSKKHTVTKCYLSKIRFHYYQPMFVYLHFSQFRSVCPLRRL